MPSAPLLADSFPAIGILGGTFNPVHLGHTHIAQNALKQLKLQELRFIPTAIPALKDQPSTSSLDRLNMLQLALQSLPALQQQHMCIDQREILRGGTSYTIDSLQSLREELGWDDRLVWLLGSDAFAQIEHWKAWDRLLDYCHFAVIARPNCEQDWQGGAAALWQQHGAQDWSELHATAHGRIVMLDIDAPNIASSDIRQRVQQGLSLQHLVCPQVADYIAQHGLYAVTH
jgi:nicotinate-nucleotide adenylyltransferase